MITNFPEFSKALKASGFTLSADDLDPQESAALIADIQSWNEETFKAATDQLHDWFSIEVPIALLKEIAASDLDLAEEIYTGGVGDTCQREILIDAVMKKLGLRSWPICMEGEEVAKAFHNQLRAAAPKFGVKILE